MTCVGVCLLYVGVWIDSLTTSVFVKGIRFMFRFWEPNENKRYLYTEYEMCTKCYIENYYKYIYTVYVGYWITVCIFKIK